MESFVFTRIDAYFEGDIAAIIKQSALSIPTVMDLKFYAAP
jgi:hypothetical protein